MMLLSVKMSQELHCFKKATLTLKDKNVIICKYFKYLVIVILIRIGSYDNNMYGACIILKIFLNSHNLKLNRIWLPMKSNNIV